MEPEPDAAFNGKADPLQKPDRKIPRDERLKSALKANMARRKAQVRARSASSASPVEADPDQAAIPPADNENTKIK